MNRAANLINLCEKFLSGFKNRGAYVEVFKNPVTQELRNLGNTKRYIINRKTQTYYVWDGDKAIHYEVCQHLKKAGIEDLPLTQDAESSSSSPNWGEYIYGVYTEKGAKQKHSSDALDLSGPSVEPSVRAACQELLDDLISEDWSWLDPYKVDTVALEDMFFRYHRKAYA